MCLNSFSPSVFLLTQKSTFLVRGRLFFNLPQAKCSAYNFDYKSIFEFLTRIRVKAAFFSFIMSVNFLYTVMIWLISANG